jgi:phage shock protein A
MTRIIRIFKADIHGVMDQLEDQNLLLKQYLRDMEEELHQKEAKLQKMMVSQNHAQQDHDRYQQQCDTLENDLTMAVQKGKDDIARMLIKKMKPMENLRAELSRHIKTLEKEITQFTDLLNRQRLRYKHLKHRSTEYLHMSEMQQWEKNAPELVADDLYRDLSQKEIELELLKRKEILGVNA